MSMQIMPSALDIGQLGNLQRWLAGFVILPSRQASCHNGCEEEPRIYARVIDLLASTREINFNDMLAFELAAYPSSMFNVDRKMYVATSKSTLKHKLQVTISERNCPISDTMMCLHFFGLPPGRLVNCVSPWTPFKAFVHQALRRANVILVFDRYFSNIFKTFTRTQGSGSIRVYKLTPEMRLQ